MNATAQTYLNDHVLKERRAWTWSQASAGNFTGIAEQRKQHESDGEADLVKAIDETLVAFKKDQEEDQTWPVLLPKAILTLLAIGLYCYFLIYKPMDVLRSGLFG